MPQVYPCAVLDCADVTAKRHRFPSPDKQPRRFCEWIEAIANPKLSTLQPKYIYNVYRVCEIHFRKEHISANKRLYKVAVPVIICPSEHSTMANVEIVCDTLERPSSSCVVTPPRQKNVFKHMEVRTPSKGKHILTAIGFTREKHLSPRKKRMYHDIQRLRKSLYRCRERTRSFKRRLTTAEKISKLSVFSGMKASLDPVIGGFFWSQLRNRRKCPQGRRFTLDDKIMAMALYKQSGRGYRFLSRLFALPSRKTIMQVLNNVQLTCGVNDSVFHHLQERVKHLSFKNKLCVLSFDEMALQPNLHWSTSQDKIIGFEDYGFETTAKVADQCLVFMVRAIYAAWKQPIVYSFCEGTTKSPILVNIIKQTIRACQNAGLEIIGLVCDQATTNTSAINFLLNDTRAQYLRENKEIPGRFIEVDGKRIVPLYDPPHLLKGIRNNFITKNVRYVNKEGQTCLAKWQDIVDCYKIDLPCGRLRIMNKLTDFHVIPSKIRKMKVSCCSQVFSYQVASGITRMSIDQSRSLDGTVIMRANAIETANLLKFFDELFDSVNGSSFQAIQGKKLRCAVSKSSPHLKFWNNAIKFLQQIRFVDSNNKESIPPSLSNWIQTLEGFKVIRKVLADKGFTHFLPRRFNQDPLENFFGRMRQHGGRNVNPTCTAFTYYFKTLLVNNLVSHHSVGSNCEADDTGNLLFTLKSFVLQSKQAIIEPDIVPLDIPSTLFEPTQLDEEALGFVSGFITKNVLQIVKNCEICKNLMLSDPSSAPRHSLIKSREYDSNLRLNYCSENLYNLLELAYKLIYAILPELCAKQNLFKTILATVMSNSTNTFICFEHGDLKSTLLKSFIKLIIFHYCNGINNILSGKDTRDAGDSLMQYCKQKFLKRRR